VKVGYHGADMSKPAEIEAMMKYAADEFGRVDILVNNAGIQHVAKVEDFPPERWDAIIAINLSSAFHTTRLALPAMREGQLGPHHQRRLGARPGGLGAEVGLRRGQARHRRPDQGDGAGDSRPPASPATRSAPAGC
jgi:NAD(P)-dependent dehydrogenase (short-subunit alcohol dehydrogenase family)